MGYLREQLRHLDLSELQMASLQTAVYLLTLRKQTTARAINDVLSYEAGLAEELAQAQVRALSNDPAQIIAHFRLGPRSALLAGQLGVFANEARAAQSSARMSAPEQIAWIDAALHSGWPVGKRYPRKFGPSASAFKEIVEACFNAAGRPSPKRAMERYPAWRRARKLKAMVAALRNTPK